MTTDTKTNRKSVSRYTAKASVNSVNGTVQLVSVEPSSVKTWIMGLKTVELLFFIISHRNGLVMVWRRTDGARLGRLDDVTEQHHLVESDFIVIGRPLFWRISSLD